MLSENKAQLFFASRWFSTIYFSTSQSNLHVLLKQSYFLMFSLDFLLPTFSLLLFRRQQTGNKVLLVGVLNTEIDMKDAFSGNWESMKSF